MREKIIDMLEEIAQKTDDERCQKCVEQNCVRCAYENIADHLIANGVTVQEWIPVTERLPEFDQKVLCYKKGEIKVGKYIGARYTGEIYAFRTLDMYMAFGATHWMPLPEPPKDGD